MKFDEEKLFAVGTFILFVGCGIGMLAGGVGVLISILIK